MYYRIAIHALTSPTWQWRSDTLHSLPVVVQWLRYFQVFPWMRLRIFSANSRDGLDALLAQQNAGHDEVSVTVEQFLRGGCIGLAEGARRASDHPAEPLEPCGPQPPASPAGVPSFPMTFAGRAAAPELWMTGSQALERRRLEVELGPGSDHDGPYRFGMPISMPEILAWVKLLVRVQRGDLRAEVVGVVSAGSCCSAQHTARQTATGISSPQARQKCPR